MIRISELSFGNIVKIGDNIHRVIEIYGNKDMVRLNGREFTTYTVDLEPVPITDEILDKNFERKAHGWQLGDMWRIWSNPNFGYIIATLVMDEFGGCSYEPCIPCTYIHELQNTLKDLRIYKMIIL